MINLVEAGSEDESGKNGRIELEEFVDFFHRNIPVTFVQSLQVLSGESSSANAASMNSKEVTSKIERAASSIEAQNDALKEEGTVRGSPLPPLKSALKVEV